MFPKEKRAKYAEKGLDYQILPFILVPEDTPRIVHSQIVGSGKALPPSSATSTVLGLLRTFSLKEKLTGNDRETLTYIGHRLQQLSPSELPDPPMSKARRLHAQFWGWPMDIDRRKRVFFRSRPGKPNQRKGQNEEFMNFTHFCEFWWFTLGKQARFTLNFCSGMPLRKVHELTFLWFGLPGPLLIFRIGHARVEKH